MENEVYVCYAILAYRRMKDLPYCEATFASILKAVIQEYNTVEIKKEIGQLREGK